MAGDEFGTAFDSLMRDVITIKQHVLQAGAAITYDYQNVATGVPANIQPVGGSRSQTIMGRFPNASHTMYMRTTPDIQANYRVVDQRGKTYEVAHVNNYFDHHLEIILEEKSVP